MTPALRPQKTLMTFHERHGQYPPPVWSRLASARPGNELRPAFAQACGFSIRTIPMRSGLPYAAAMIKSWASESRVQWSGRYKGTLSYSMSRLPCRPSRIYRIDPRICWGYALRGGAGAGGTRRWRFSRNKQGHLVRGTVRSLAPRQLGRRSPVRVPGSCRPLIWWFA